MQSSNIRSKASIYKSNIEWLGAKKCVASAIDKPNIEVSTPVEFKGFKGLWTPAELLLASVNSCLLLTFISLAEKEKIKIISYKSSIEGTIEGMDAERAFTKIKISPTITVSSAGEVEKAKDLLNLSEKLCPMSNSLKSEVILSPIVVEQHSS